MSEIKQKLTVVEVQVDNLREEQTTGGIPVVRLDLMRGGRRVSVELTISQRPHTSHVTVTMEARKPTRSVRRAIQVKPWVNPVGRPRGTGPLG